MALIREPLVAWLAERAPIDPHAITDDTPLFSTNLVDSFVMVEMIVFLEESLGRTIPTGDVTLENLDTLGAILAYGARGGG